MVGLTKIVWDAARQFSFVQKIRAMGRGRKAPPPRVGRIIFNSNGARVKMELARCTRRGASGQIICGRIEENREHGAVSIQMRVRKDGQKWTFR